MEQTRNFYLDLRVPRDASAEEIRHAYKEAARLYHPDVNQQPGSSDLFIDIQEAYETLSDPKKREKYDDILGLNPIQNHQ